MNYILYLQHFYRKYFDEVRVEYSEGLFNIQGDKGKTIYAFSFYPHELDFYHNINELEEFLENFLANIFRDKDLISYYRVLKKG